MAKFKLQALEGPKKRTKISGQPLSRPRLEPEPHKYDISYTVHSSKREQ